MNTPTQAEYRIPLENGLSFLVDAEDYPLVSKYQWTIENGRVCPAGATPKWMSSRSLARHLANAAPDTWTLYRNGYRLDLRKSNLTALSPADWWDNWRNDPVPEVAPPESKYEGTAWSSRFKAWTTPSFVKHYGHPLAVYFADEADAAEYATERRMWAVENGRSPEGIEPSEYQSIPLYPSANLIGALGGSRDAHSALGVYLVLRSFALKPGATSCYASRKAIAGYLGCDEKTISRALNVLKSANVIDFTPTRSSQVKRFGERFFRPWLPHAVTFTRQFIADEVPGLFPIELLRDERYPDLSFKAQAVLMALYTLARGENVASIPLSELASHAFLTEKYTLQALHEIQKRGLVAGVPVASRGKRVGYKTENLQLILPEIEMEQKSPKRSFI